jgi:hypothetical protein
MIYSFNLRICLKISTLIAKSRCHFKDDHRMAHRQKLPLRPIKNLLLFSILAVKRHLILQVIYTKNFIDLLFKNYTGLFK